MPSWTRVQRTTSWAPQSSYSPFQYTWEWPLKISQSSRWSKAWAFCSSWIGCVWKKSQIQSESFYFCGACAARCHTGCVHHVALLSHEILGVKSETCQVRWHAAAFQVSQVHLPGSLLYPAQRTNPLEEEMRLALQRCTVRLLSFRGLLVSVNHRFSLTWRWQRQRRYQRPYESGSQKARQTDAILINLTHVKMVRGIIFSNETVHFAQATRKLAVCALCSSTELWIGSTAVLVFCVFPFAMLNTTALNPDKPSPKVIMMSTGFVQGALALMVHYNIIWSNQIIRPHVSVPERIATFDDCCDCGFTYCIITVYSTHIWFWIKIRWSGSPYPVFPAVSLEFFLKLNRARLFLPAGDLKNHKDVLWAANLADSTQKSLNQRCHLWISLLVYFFLGGYILLCLLTRSLQKNCDASVESTPLRGRFGAVISILWRFGNPRCWDSEFGRAGWWLFYGTVPMPIK